ncbi:sterol desaturase family protein [Microcoleus sp. bin38.metabat.b11b12b14.051]|uniref:sterol desaturase family protein n=1 Tax=Microcoleus sp. bin38.metabat.b11b12b14.051 TaxID=2742709 RepID=UPI0025EBF2D9|nr:sterol desaturase family protein [Microcoleus sp. bin38.metabat.b11b12b14.051]
MLPEIVKGFIILACIFIPLERIFSLHKQKIFRLGWATDATYFFTGHFIGKSVAIVATVTLSMMTNFLNPELQSKVASQPVWLQFVEVVIVSDLAYYIAHRLLHEVPWLWQFHAVHHSIERMDWLAAVRVHPCEQVFTQICKILPLFWLGFTKENLVVYGLYSAAIAFLIHANINIRFGVLKWFVATPEFHQWHHTKIPEIYNKNFAVQLPLLDLLFGTLYMPAGKRPQKYGISDRISVGYLGQLLYPFLGTIKMLNDKFKKDMIRYLRPLRVFSGVCLITVCTLSAFALINHMDIPTFAASLNAKKVTVAELQQGKLKSVILIDVRSPEEYAEDRIGESPLVPLIDIEAGFGVKQVQAIARSSVNSDRTQPTIVLYCARGGRSVKAYQKLQKTNLSLAFLSGGITAWREAVRATQDAQILAPISRSLPQPVTRF